MPRTSKYKRLRGKVAAKKALAELRESYHLTMRSDAIEAAHLAEGELEEFIDSNDSECLVRALQHLRSGRGGAVGDADIFFQNAIDEIEARVSADD